MNGTGYLLDTNIVIYYLEGVLTKSGKEFVKDALVDGGRISIISKIELLAWLPPQGADINKIITFLSQARIHYLNDETANITIDVKRSHRRIKLPDAIIAATTLAAGLTLIIRNTSDFSSIKELQIIDPFQL